MIQLNKKGPTGEMEMSGRTQIEAERKMSLDDRAALG
jgi:hypothetical protein